MNDRYELRVYWHGKAKRLVKRFRFSELPTADEVMEIIFDYAADSIDIERF